MVEVVKKENKSRLLGCDASRLLSHHVTMDQIFVVPFSNSSCLFFSSVHFFAALP